MKRKIFLGVLIALGFLVGIAFPVYRQFSAVQTLSIPMPEDIQATVNNIRFIAALSQKAGEPQPDENAIKIVNLGKKAAPYLVEKITDDSPSLVADFFAYKIGDLALALLMDIYQAPNWPFPDGVIQLPNKYGDFRDYVDFVNKRGARDKLKQSWKMYIQSH
jgi:hypothetical protein